ncbi:hypothetical protein WJX79_008234 [Trebouxia sp. C0005]|nr:MAG: hypothetical protein FRX49_12903 [Trebouxia sp. A1-2]
MTQYYTDQDRIDAQTMRIENPNIVGSGYIQFPPQRPFEKPVQVQPPTVAHLEYPQEYQQYSGSAQPASRPAAQPSASSSTQIPQANGNARGPGTPSLPQGGPNNPAQPRQAVPQPQAQAPAGRQGYDTRPQPPAAYHTAVGGQAHAGRAPQQRPAQAPPSQGQPIQPVSHYTPNHAPQQRQDPTANASHAPLPQSVPPQARVPAAAMRPTAALTSPAAVAASSKGDDDDDKSGMSKAQKKRLRKKMREGGI